MKLIFDIVFVMSCMLAGNYIGDQATIRACATSGEAKMLGGGNVACTIVTK